MLGDTDQRQLDRTVALLLDVLGSDAIAAYVFGSAVLGGLRPESDLDVLAVCKRPTTDAEKQRLVSRLLDISGRETEHGRWRYIELTIVVHDDVKPWRYPPRLDFQYGDWWRDDFERGNLEPWSSATNPDLAVLITMARLGNEPVLGPPPTEIFDPVPRDDLIRAMVDGIDALLDDLKWDTRNVILTFARIWTTVVTGVIRSKDAAADWVLKRLPESHRPIVAHARAIYLGDEPERWDGLEDRVGPCADYMINQIKAVARRDPGP